MTQILELLDITLLRHFVEGYPQDIVGTDKRFGDIGGIYQVLTCYAPAQIVWTLGIYGMLVG